MKVTMENRKQVWDSLPSPKPDWETFKRLMRTFKGDLDKGLKAWSRKTH
jgi:hypothetical protein